MGPSAALGNYVMFKSLEGQNHVQLYIYNNRRRTLIRCPLNFLHKILVFMFETNDTLCRHRMFCSHR